MNTSCGQTVSIPAVAGDDVINLIHYSDAAKAVVSALELGNFNKFSNFNKMVTIVVLKGPESEYTWRAMTTQ